MGTLTNFNCHDWFLFNVSILILNECYIMLKVTLETGVRVRLTTVHQTHVVKIKNVRIRTLADIHVSVLVVIVASHVTKVITVQSNLCKRPPSNKDHPVGKCLALITPH